MFKKWVLGMPINFSIFHNLVFIVEDNMKSHPEECKEWFKQLLNMAEKYIDEFGKEKFISKVIICVPKTLAWLSENDKNYCQSIKTKIDKLREIGALNIT